MGKIKQKQEKVSWSVIPTPVGIIMYPYLIEPHTNGQYADGYTKLDLYVRSQDWSAQANQPLIEHVKAVYLETFEESINNIVAPEPVDKGFQLPFVDSNGIKSENFPEELRDCVRIRLKTRALPNTSNDDPVGGVGRPVTVVGPDKQPLTKEQIEAIKSGDYGRAAIRVYGYSKSQGGLSIALEMLQFQRAGKAIATVDTYQKNLSVLDAMEVPLDDFTEDQVNI